MGDNLVMPLADRDSILSVLIDDLRTVAPDMRFARDLSEGVERASKEFCWSLIARMAMTRAGYSLRPDKGNPMAKVQWNVLQTIVIIMTLLVSIVILSFLQVPTT